MPGILTMPTDISIAAQWLDLVIVNRINSTVTILELSVPFETNISDTHNGCTLTSSSRHFQIPAKCTSLWKRDPVAKGPHNQRNVISSNIHSDSLNIVIITRWRQFLVLLYDTFNGWSFLTQFYIHPHPCGCIYTQPISGTCQTSYLGAALHMASSIAGCLKSMPCKAALNALLAVYTPLSVQVKTW